MRLSECLAAEEFGAEVVQHLERAIPVNKSAGAQKRPTPAEHYQSLRANTHYLQPKRITLIDDVITVTDENAITTTRQLAKQEGLLVGTSSGANVWSAIKLASTFDKNIVTVLPDRAERYFSTSLI